ncbi:MAG: hypothetical protein AAF962_18080 [Actinomycetota bacterium]
MPVPARSVRRLRAFTVAVFLVLGAACSSPSDSSSGTDPGAGSSSTGDGGARSGAAGAEPAGDGVGDDDLVARNHSPGLKELSGDAVRTRPQPDD